MTQLPEDFDGYLIRDNSSNKSMYYLTDFEVHDDVTYLRTDDKDFLLVAPLEISRARKEASVDEVISTAKYTEGDTRDDREKEIKNTEKMLKDQGIEKLAVPGDFPLMFADKLREGFDVKPVEDFVIEERKTKSDREIKKMENRRK